MCYTVGMSKIQIIMRVLSDSGELEKEAQIEYQNDSLFRFPEYREAAFKQAEWLLCRKLAVF